MAVTWGLDANRCFDPDPAQRTRAAELYAGVAALPLVCPHGHVAPSLLADPAARFGSPADLFIIPDHYVTRMLYSQGVALEALSVRSRDGTPTETDHRAIWQRFADHFGLFRGTPSGLWLTDALVTLFGVDEKLNSQNAQRIYDQIAERLAQPDYQPRALFRRFGIEVLSTTDAPWDTLTEHAALQAAGFAVRPTFRPDGVVNLDSADWQANLARLAAVCNTAIGSYHVFVRCLEERRAFFAQHGAVATDHGCVTPRTERLSDAEAGAIFGRALRGVADATDATRFTAHMLVEMARMSCADGLVMQIHAGSYRNHNRSLFARFGPDAGADIPVQTEWTHNLAALLDAHGNDPHLRLILFGLDESTYSRELAPLAGHYPAVLLGPPWWFHDSVNGIERYLDSVVETAGLANCAGFNDDTRAFASIPARHGVWRRVTCNWLAGLEVRGLIDAADAEAMAHDLAVGLARRAYNLPTPKEGEHDRPAHAL